MDQEPPRSIEDLVLVMQRRGASFASIEDFINGLDMSEERRSVLWLLAWSERPYRERRDVIVGARTD